MRRSVEQHPVLGRTGPATGALGSHAVIKVLRRCASLYMAELLYVDPDLTGALGTTVGPLRDAAGPRETNVPSEDEEKG